MTLSEFIIVTFLTCFDWVMDFITFGQWWRVRGDQRVIIKIRKQPDCFPLGIEERQINEEKAQGSW